jgi:excisionase family DNA binding protein
VQQVMQAPSPQAMADPDEKFDRKAAARYIGVSGRTLEKWAVRGGGPIFIKAGSRVIFRRRDLDAWLTERERRSTSDQGRISAGA